MVRNSSEQLKRYSQLSVALSKAYSREQAAEMMVTLGSSLLGGQAAGVWIGKKNAHLKLVSHIGRNVSDFERCTDLLNDSFDVLRQVFFSDHDIFIGNLSHLKNVSQLYTNLQSITKSCVIAGFKTQSFYGYLIFFLSHMRKLSSSSNVILSSSVENFVRVIEKQMPVHSQLPAKEDNLRKLIGLQHITSLLQNAPTKERVGEIMIKEAFKMTDAQVGEVALIDEAKQEYKKIAEVGYPQKLKNSWPTVYKIKDNYLSNIVLQSGKPLFISNPQRIDKKYTIMQNIIKTTGIKSLSLLPLKIKNKVIGIMNFHYYTPQTFSNFDKKILFLLAQQCSQALDRIISRENFQQSQLNLEKILFKIGDGVIIRNVEGKILLINKEAEILYGISDNANKKIIVIKDDQGNEINSTEFQYKKILENPMFYESDIAITWSNEVTQWIRVKSFPISHNKSLQYIVDVLQDITDLKQKEQIKEEFISIASHELKTPLTSLTLYLQTLQMSLEHKDYENVVSLVGHANNQVERIALLVKDMLDITKMKYGSTRLLKKHVILKDLVKKTVEEQQLSSMSHTISFKARGNEKVMVDIEKIRQVLNNLINNAVKYSPNASRVDVTVGKTNNGVKVCITDYGVGINKIDLETIFKPFARTQNPQKLRVPGMGLGLYIAMEIIKAHNGKLWVKSNLEEKQTSFCFLLPLA